MRASAETASSPVEVILAWYICMNMPLVFTGVVLSSISVHQTLHIDHGVSPGVVNLLSAMKILDSDQVILTGEMIFLMNWNFPLIGLHLKFDLCSST